MLSEFTESLHVKQIGINTNFGFEVFGQYDRTFALPLHRSFTETSWIVGDRISSYYE
jgi:hypothetical protein